MYPRANIWKYNSKDSHKHDKQGMQSQESQTTETENNVPLTENEPEYINPQKSSQSEPITQIQRDSILTNQDLPDPRLRYGLTLVILTVFLFVVAIYYGIINP
jgi:cytochrome oxidase assembly protein ShyY1